MSCSQFEIEPPFRAALPFRGYARVSGARSENAPCPRQWFAAETTGVHMNVVEPQEILGAREKGVGPAWASALLCRLCRSRLQRGWKIVWKIVCSFSFKCLMFKRSNLTMRWS